jgi:PadR family transcriptional regulator PadR
VTEPIQIQLKKGAFEPCVLAWLVRRESESYEIASTLAAEVDMGEGTIYPLMRRLQNDGLIDVRLVESRSSPPRKYCPLYTHRQRGFLHVEARVAGVHRFRRSVARRSVTDRVTFFDTFAVDSPAFQRARSMMFSPIASRTLIKPIHQSELRARLAHDRIDFRRGECLSSPQA